MCLTTGGKREGFDNYDPNGDGALDARGMEMRGVDQVDQQDRMIYKQEGMGGKA